MKKKYAKPNFFGFSIPEVKARTGLPSVTIWRHIHQKRSVSPELAILYSNTLGIPRSELRPDLWPPEQGDSATQD